MTDQPTSRYRAVLFDLDGTLLDSIEDLTDSMNASLAALGFAPRTVEQCKVFVGDGMELFAARALPQASRDEATITKVAAGHREQYSRRWADKSHPYPGVAQLLDELATRRIKLAVLSNKPNDFTRLILARLLAKWRFDRVVGARDGVPMKPDPVAALQIATQLKIAPAEFLYVGDTNTDMQTAVAAGMYPVGALWGFRKGDELLASGAKALIEHPLDLLKLL